MKVDVDPSPADMWYMLDKANGTGTKDNGEGKFVMGEVRWYSLMAAWGCLSKPGDD